LFLITVCQLLSLFDLLRFFYMYNVLKVKFCLRAVKVTGRGDMMYERRMKLQLFKVHSSIMVEKFEPSPKKSPWRRILSQPSKKRDRRVRFDVSSNSCHHIPKFQKECSWYSQLDYSFFMLNWKYRSNESMEAREFMDILLGNTSSPASERMEDFQSFNSDSHVRRTKIRKALLKASKHKRSRKRDSLAPISRSLSLNDYTRAQKMAKLNAKEVTEYQNVSQTAGGSEDIIQEYMDAVLSKLSPLELWKRT
jgi:hypothetical protein